MFKIFFLSLLLLGTLLNATAPSEATVTRLYIATFDRAPDAAGLKYWLNDSGLDLEGIAISFFDQDETKEKYPVGFSHTDFIQAIYKNLFKRGADADGFEYWHGELETQKVGRSVFILAVINGALGDDAKVLANKLTVGLKFVEAKRDDVDEAYTIFLNITADPATVNPTLCKHTLTGCYIAPKPKEEEKVIEEEKEKEETPATPTSSGGSTSSGASSGNTASSGNDTSTNTAPVANAGDNKIDVARTVPEAISGMGSSDADNDTLTYLWSVTSSPSGSNPTIDSSTSAETTFTADKAGVYTLSLVVNDGTVDSPADTMTITVTPPSTLKKTGQTESSATGDDGTYKAGVAHSYYKSSTVSGDSIVTDNVTKLIWQDSDIQSGKEWTEAGTYCTSLSFANSTEWRLPTVKELLYIVDSSTITNPAGGFTVTASSNFWSSTASADNADDADDAWYVGFGAGDAFSGNKNYHNSVRCVRAG